MIVLDTNVVSEVAKGAGCHPRVRGWLETLDEQPVTTVLNRAEVLAGIALLPEGARRSGLARDVEHLITGLQRCLPLTEECAEVYAAVVSARTRAGLPVGAMDALIASIALVNGAGVATRDVGGFEGLGLRVVDPWAG